MVWTDEFSLRIDEIDNQHKTLIGLVSHVESSLDSANGWCDANPSLGDLIEFASTHFALEQALMRLHGYQGFARHTASNWYFFDELNRLQRLTFNASSKQAISRFLVRWLTNHINVSDRTYARHLLSCTLLICSYQMDSIPDMPPGRRGMRVTG